MLRYSVLPGERFVNATCFRTHVGGAESNVCAALSQLGRRCGWTSALPNNALGKLILNKLNEVGVDTSTVQLIDHGRVGTYYLESSLPPRASTIFYDRAESAFTKLKAADINLDAILDTAIIHVTGITPSLGDRPREALTTVVQEARRRGVLVSFDINYREKLWSPTEAAEVITTFTEQADILFCSLRDAVRLFGSAQGGSNAINVLRERTSASLIVVSMGDRGIHAIYENSEFSIPAIHTAVVDRPGAGDAMVAGILDGYLDGDVLTGLKRGAVLASMALSHRGDMVCTSRQEIAAAMSSTEEDIMR